MSTFETLAIDREVVRLTKKNSPLALFIPTASDDAAEYFRVFSDTYQEKLGCRATVLNLVGRTPTRRELRNTILESDLIYVGGGNTLRMMRIWRRLGVDRLLGQAYRRGIVLSGLSAGCICWFTHGHSDSMSFYHPDNWDYIRVKGLGFIDALGCPHYDVEKRDKNFQKMVRKHNALGIALDNNCALEVIDDQYRIITSRKGSHAYKVYSRRGSIVTETIEQVRRFHPVKHLVNKP